MEVKKIALMMGIVSAVILNVSAARASVLLNEIFADPASGLSGDANMDGIRSGTQDEFVEFLNTGAAAEDISGWSLADNVSIRHIFPLNTVLASKAFLVVFGGGVPVLPGINWQVASSGTLSLNNDGDTLVLTNAQGQTIDQVLYGINGGKDQSLTRFPDGTGTEFVLHSEIDEAQGNLFSPGYGLKAVVVELPPVVEVPPMEELPPAVELPPTEENSTENPVVPELPALVYFGSGWGALLLRQRAWFLKA